MSVMQFTSPAPVEGQGYGINWDTAEQRVQELKDFLMTAPQVMDPERLRCLLDVYDEFAGESTLYIRAKLFERVLLTKKIFLDGNPIVGTLTGIRCGVNPYPEWNVSWIKDEMQLAKMTSLGEMKIPQETQDLLEKVYKKWKNRTCIALNNKMYKDKYGVNPAQYSKAGMYYDNVSVASGSGIADYPKALNKGLRWVVDDLKKRLHDCPTTLDNKEKHDLYRAMIVATEAADRSTSPPLCRARGKVRPRPKLIRRTRLNFWKLRKSAVVCPNILPVISVKPFSPSGSFIWPLKWNRWPAPPLRDATASVHVSLLQEGH